MVTWESHQWQRHFPLMRPPVEELISTCAFLCGRAEARSWKHINIQYGSKTRVKMDFKWKWMNLAKRAAGFVATLLKKNGTNKHIYAWNHYGCSEVLKQPATTVQQKPASSKAQEVTPHNYHHKRTHTGTSQNTPTSILHIQAVLGELENVVISRHSRKTLLRHKLKEL